MLWLDPKPEGEGGLGRGGRESRTRRPPTCVLPITFSFWLHKEDTQVASKAASWAIGERQVPSTRPLCTPIGLLRTEETAHARRR